MLRQSLVGFVLKVGLASSLLYVALFSFFRPLEAIAHYPNFLAQGIDDRGVVYVIGILCLFLIGWIFSGKQKFASSLVSTFLIAVVALINITQFAFAFSLVPTFAIGLALVFRYYPRIRVIAKTPLPGTRKKLTLKELIEEDDLEEVQHDDELIAEQTESDTTAPTNEAPTESSTHSDSTDSDTYPVENSPEESDTK